jgi:hypothetical protein
MKQGQNISVEISIRKRLIIIFNIFDKPSLPQNEGLSSTLYCLLSQSLPLSTTKANPVHHKDNTKTYDKN